VTAKAPSRLLAAAVFSLSAALAGAQGAPAPGPESKKGPASIPKHWSKYKYPESVPDGAAYHIIEKGDTLWEIAGHYLKSPLLWPQVWEQNKYITDSHWIYPGDPVILKKIEVVAEKAGETPELPKEPEPAPPPPEAPVPPPLYPATEPLTLQCASLVASSGEDKSFTVIGSEEGKVKSTFSERDILYISKGSSGGVKPGDVFSVHRMAHKVKNVNGKTLGTKVLTLGWIRVILAKDNSATAVVEQSCSAEIAAGDYLKPFEKVAVPQVLRQDPPDRTTPSTGRGQGTIVDIGDEQIAAAAGHLVTLDVGSSAGLAPGNTMTISRVVYPKVPTSRRVMGELVVLRTQASFALGKVLYSTDAILRGDSVELR
jgi:hypothetical protein